MRFLTSVFLAFSLVVSCSSKSNNDTSLTKTLFETLKARKEAKKNEGKSQVPPPALTRAAIKHIEKPLLRISAQTLGVKTLFAQVARNGDYRTYLNNLKMSVTFKNGIITATRGFGLDLLSQGISIPTKDVFAETNAPKFYTRTQQQLVKTKTVVELDYNCVLEKTGPETITIVEVEYPLMKYTESCRNTERAFNNFYWVDDNTQKIWKSAQSIGQQAGYFITEVLVP